MGTFSTYPKLPRVWFAAEWPDRIGLFGDPEPAKSDVWSVREWDASIVQRTKRSIRANGGRVVAVGRMKKKEVK